MSINKPNITYLLGAGASFNSLPLVSEMYSELNKMDVYIDGFEFKRNAGAARTFLSEMKLEIASVKEHLSIDTLARKYWLRSLKDKSYERKYIRIKNLITCLILFRSLKFKDKDGVVADPTTTISKDANISRNTFKIDTRYEAFFAALINKECQIPPNIKILSWNYDFQIEKSFQFYNSGLNLKEIGNGMGINYVDFNATNISNQIIKLNGTALLFEGQNYIDLNKYDLEAHEIFLRALRNDFDTNLFSAIKFAWEDDSNISKNRTIASKIIKNSRYVVVIGYSFPIFNREVDIQIFDGFVLDENHRVFIQAPDGDAQRYLEQLESIKYGLGKHAEVKTNTDQFFIPPLQWIKEPDNFL